MGRSAFIAALAVIALVLWMLSGQIGSKENDAQTETEATEAEKPKVRMKVQTRLQKAESITREVVLQGQLEPVQVLTVRSETSASVVQLPSSKGQRATRGQTLALLSTDNRNSTLTVAKANLAQANNEYQAARKLQKQGLQSALSLEAASAKREAARAQVKSAELELATITITSPIDGLIEDVMVKEGGFVERGAELVKIIDNSQMLVTGRIPQQHIADVKQGQTAIAKLVTGQTLEGKINYISSMADETRSFKVEVLIDSPPEGTPMGVSTQINIPVETLQAHRISPAILALDENGDLGVKAVAADNTVTFHTIEIVKTESNGAWVTGIPDEATIIIMGQGFVNPGEEVEPIPEVEDSSANGNTNLIGNRESVI